MESLIPIWLIYFAGICDNIKMFFEGTGWTIIIITGVFLFIYSMGTLEWTSFSNKCVKFIALGAIFLFVSVFVPTQKTVYTIMVASQVTPDNIKLVGGTMKSTVDYMFEKTEVLIKSIKDKEGDEE
jgi:membrane-bound ClpP family serine protease